MLPEYIVLENCMISLVTPSGQNCSADPRSQSVISCVKGRNYAPPLAYEKAVHCKHCFPMQNDLPLQRRDDVVNQRRTVAVEDLKLSTDLHVKQHFDSTLACQMEP